MRQIITRQKLAEALSIVAEAGPQGFAYNSAVNSLIRGYFYRSKKQRWMLACSPRFSATEFRVLLGFAAREGFLDSAYLNRIANEELSEKLWQIKLTLKGYDQVELYDRPILHQWAANVRDNIPTIVIATAISLSAAWAIQLIGPNIENETTKTPLSGTIP